MEEWLNGLNRIYPKIAFLYAIVSYCATAIMQILLKCLYQVIDPFSCMLWRAVALLAIYGVIIIHTNDTPYVIQPQIFRSVVSRLLYSIGMTIPYFYCIQYIPLSTTITLQNTSPIWAFFLEYILFQKSFNAARMLLTVVCFMGVVLIIQPAFLFPSSEQDIFSSPFLLWVGLVGLVGGFCTAMNLIKIHSQAGKLSYSANLVYTCLAQVAFSGITLNLIHPRVETQSIGLINLCQLALVVLCAFLSQYFIVLANSLQSPSLTMPFAYTAILVSFLADTVYFGVQFNLLSIAGLLLTSVGLLAKLFLKQGPLLGVFKK